VVIKVAMTRSDGIFGTRRVRITRGERQGRAVAGELLCEREADARRRPGDHHDLVAKAGRTSRHRRVLRRLDIREHTEAGARRPA
jgi:hypothetical protein